MSFFSVMKHVAIHVAISIETKIFIIGSSVSMNINGTRIDCGMP